jgi:hypothetical protein
MTLSASVARRALISWPWRRVRQPARRRRQRGQYRDIYFADPAVVENDYWRMRRR